MKRVSLIVAMLFAVVLTASAQVQVPTNDGTPVQDKAHILTADQNTQLDGKLRAYQTKTGRAVVVLIVPTLDGASVEEFANVTFHQWGIGQKGKDNGVLFLWSTGDRKVRIEVGYGLEGILPDGRAGLIIQESILPAFKAGQWYTGVSTGVNDILTQLDREPDPVAPPSGNHNVLLLVIVIGFIVIVIVAAAVYFTSQDEPEPYVPMEPYVPHYHYEPSPHSDAAIVAAMAAAAVTRSAPRHEEEEEEHHYESHDDNPSPSFDSGGSSFGGFSGGDSGGGGASGSY
jgi:uncharacterized protein